MNKAKQFLSSVNWVVLKAVPDSLYIRLMYSKFCGGRLDLRQPVTFNEKMNYAKLHNRDCKLTKLVDKYEVRQYVREKVGEQYLVPVLGVYNRIENIAFDTLPNRFVLKTTHDSGSVVVCHDKKQLNIEKVKERLSFALRRNYYWVGREWPYKNVVPRIICEQLLEDSITDWKFYVFHGIPKYLYLGRGLVSDHSLRISFFDIDMNPAPFGRKDYPGLECSVAKPNGYEEMIEIASRLAGDLPFARVDLYNVGGRGTIYFSEITLTPASGWMPFDPPEYDRILGDML